MHPVAVINNKNINAASSPTSCSILPSLRSSPTTVGVASSGCPNNTFSVKINQQATDPAYPPTQPISATYLPTTYNLNYQHGSASELASTTASVTTINTDFLTKSENKEGRACTPPANNNTHHQPTTPPQGASLTISQHSCSGGCDNADLLEGACAVIMTLVMKGDSHWEATHPRRCKSTAAKMNIQHTITGMMESLKESGLLSDEVLITSVVYLRRLSAQHVKYVSRFTIKKYMAVSCFVANKTCSDQYYSLDCFTEATGMSKTALCEAELQFLSHIEFKVQIGLLCDHNIDTEKEEDKVGFQNTQVLIHDMATAAAATSQSMSTFPMFESTLDSTEAEEEKPMTTFAPNGSSSSALGIAAIVEGILSAVDQVAGSTK